MKAPSFHYLWVLPAIVTIVGLGSGGAAVPQTGTVKGVVIDADSGMPIADVNVQVVGVWRGGFTSDEGIFAIERVPVGIAKIAVWAMGHRGKLIDSVTVNPSEETLLDITLEKRWPVSESEIRSVVGTEVDVVGDDLSCEIRPSKDRFSVGDHPEFTVVLRNNSDETCFLVGAIDDSETRARYPIVYVTIEGPEDGISRPTLHGCGFQNPLAPRDFVELPPGGTIAPITPPFWRPSDAFHAEFAIPGTYEVTFHYSSDEADYALWIGESSGGYALPGVIDKLKRVPRVEIECSITVEVYEE